MSKRIFEAHEPKLERTLIIEEWSDNTGYLFTMDSVENSISLDMSRLDAKRMIEAVVDSLMDYDNED